MNEVERAGSSKEVDLLPSGEEKLDGLNLHLLGLAVDKYIQESVMSEKEVIL